MTYRYLGDRLTRPELKGAHCRAVRRADGKCIRGKNEEEDIFPTHWMPLPEPPKQ